MRSACGSLAVLLAAVSTAFAEDPPDSDFLKHLKAGIAETARSDLSNAMGDLQIALQLNSKSSEAHYRMGLVLGQTVDLRAAETEFRRALELDPKFAEAYYNLGLTLIGNPQSKLDWPDAIEAFRKALQFRSEYAEAANYLGAGLQAIGDDADAVTELERAVKWKPDLAEAHLNLGLAFEGLHHADDALREYRLAEQSRSIYPAAATAVGKLLLHKGDMTEAVREISGALRANPDLIDAHYALARALQSQKKSDAASVEFDQVNDLTQRRADAIQCARLSNEGLETAAKGDMDGALKLEQQAVALQPDYGLAHLNLGLILADAGHWREAERQLIQAASLLPTRAEPWFDLARVMQRNGEAESAHVALAWAAHLAPSDERKVESTPIFKPALGAQGDTAPAHLSFAHRLSAAGDFAGASGELLRALDLDPANVEARCGLAAAYAHLGKNHEAALEFHKVLLVDPENRQAKAALADSK